MFFIFFSTFSEKVPEPTYQSYNHPQHSHYQFQLLTIHFQFTELIESETGIPSRIRRVDSVVVVDDVSSMCDTRDVCRIRYCGPRIVCVLKT